MQNVGVKAAVCLSSQRLYKGKTAVVGVPCWHEQQSAAVAFRWALLVCGWELTIDKKTIQ
jgi:hypothetical protein